MIRDEQTISQGNYFAEMYLRELSGQVQPAILTREISTPGLSPKVVDYTVILQMRILREMKLSPEQLQEATNSPSKCQAEAAKRLLIENKKCL